MNVLHGEQGKVVDPEKKEKRKKPEEVMTPEELETAKVLGEFIKKQREKKDLGVRELCRVAERSTSSGRSISPGYYSQVENGKVFPSKITMDFFWAIGVVLEIDPLKLFVLSRMAIPERLQEGEARDRIFKVR